MAIGIGKAINDMGKAMAKAEIQEKADKIGAQLEASAFGVRLLTPLEDEREARRRARLVEALGPRVLSEADLARYQEAYAERERLAKLSGPRKLAPAGAPRSASPSTPACGGTMVRRPRPPTS